MVDDARSRTKTYLNSYLSNANLLKDDAATQVSFIIQYTYQSYPFKRVFYSPKNVDLIFAIDNPTSEPRMDWDGYINGYREQVPIIIQCPTKQGIDGNKLRWQADAELRRVVETYPMGSYRAVSQAVPFDQRMGTWTLYGVKVTLSYERDKT